jgi:transcriptional regulator with XRE-family HTH domain
VNLKDPNLNFVLEQRLITGRKIKEIRERRGYSQEHLADMMDVSRTTISKIENGKFSFSIDYLSKLSFFLKFEFNLTAL